MNNKVSCQNFLATSLAERLNECVPTDFRAEAVGGEFILFWNNEPEYQLSANDLWEESRSEEDNLTTITSAIINSVQDVIALLTTEIWPPDPTFQNIVGMSEFSLPNNQLDLWFEASEEVVLRLKPIDFTGLLKEHDPIN